MNIATDKDDAVVFFYFSFLLSPFLIWGGGLDAGDASVGGNGWLEMILDRPKLVSLTEKIDIDADKARLDIQRCWNGMYIVKEAEMKQERKNGRQTVVEQHPRTPTCARYV